MDGFKIAGSPGLSGIFPGNDTIKDYPSLFKNSLTGIFRCRFSDGTFFLIHQGALNILGVAAVATGSLYNRVAASGRGSEFIVKIPDATPYAGS
ncbi:hypothetical protein KK083_20365 [Fulvivirgaceae bacterium PWU4]|uniref:Uncharacterized protein n=1 Tax=Chryseosolibacter histidini TaxID=2782349 RepID=A0AAP2GPM1_9BACT|nr:hypothetical protein [Chryseosolibacter histidini]MBT1699263.1 hypothetical protein [Chryseosolibacter histidini]